MTTRYLLPCSCGNKVPVEPRQAGEALTCHCGLSLNVPTMLEMKSLERVTSGSPARRQPAPWGSRQSLVLLGAAITVLSATLGVWLAFARPTPPLDDLGPIDIRQRAERLTPAASWHYWRFFRARGLDRRILPEQQDYAERLLRYRLAMGAVVLVVAAGLALIVVPLLANRLSTTSGYSRRT